MYKVGLEERKKIQFCILQTVDSFCNRNQITYFLSSGTLLGAVRHGGYIPWDDDIDIAMPRPDYEKFIRIFNEDNYNVVDSMHDDNFPYHLAKIIDKRTFLKEKRHKYDDLGIHIDLFPLDGVPANLRQWKWHLFKINKYRYLREIKCLVVSDVSNGGKRICFYLAKASLFFLSKKFLAKRIYKLLTQYSWEDAMFVASLASTTEKIPCRKDNFKETTFAMFEGRKFKIPAGFDCWLRLIFGDYMQLPPLEKRVISHNVEAYKFEKKS